MKPVADRSGIRLRDPEHPERTLSVDDNIIMPHEVFETLRTLKPSSCYTAYQNMIVYCSVEHDLEAEGEWVLGRIRASFKDVAEKIGRSESHFRYRIWPALRDSGLVRQPEKGIIEIPKLYRKEWVYKSPVE
jgi:hypothetical protein